MATEAELLRRLDAGERVTVLTDRGNPGTIKSYYQDEMSSCLRFVLCLPGGHLSKEMDAEELTIIEPDPAPERSPGALIDVAGESLHVMETEPPVEELSIISRLTQLQVEKMAAHKGTPTSNLRGPRVVLSDPEDTQKPDDDLGLDRQDVQLSVEDYDRIRREDELTDEEQYILRHLFSRVSADNGNRTPLAEVAAELGVDLDEEEQESEDAQVASTQQHIDDRDNPGRLTLWVDEEGDAAWVDPDRVQPWLVSDRVYLPTNPRGVAFLLDRLALACGYAASIALEPIAEPDPDADVVKVLERSLWQDDGTEEDARRTLIELRLRGYDITKKETS